MSWEMELSIARDWSVTILFLAWIIILPLIERALSTIIGINGYYYDEDNPYTPEEIENNEYVSEEAVEGMINDLEKSKVALSAENLAEVFPDAVRTDSEARLYIDYNAVVTILVEAVKQQQSQIELLRKALEENGLMEPEK